MPAEENLKKEVVKSKSLYKRFLLLLKYIPMLIALCYALNTLAAIFNIDCFVLSHISGLSFLTWIFIYLSAIVFEFCIYHRLFLWYVLVDDIFSIIDYYVDIPINRFNIIAIHSLLIIILLFLLLYFHVKNNKRLNRKNI